MPVARGAVVRNAVRLSLQAIASGLGLVFFPEGTRSKTENFLEPRAGIGMIAAHAKCPIVPTYLHGPNRLKDCFLRRQRMAVIYGEPLSAEWVISCGSGKAAYLKIAQTIMDRIRALKEGYVSHSNAALIKTNG